MYYLKQKKKNIIRLELAPLLDVVFILLIFFAVATTLMVKNQGMLLQLPKIDTINTTKTPFTLSISKETSLFFNKQEISLQDLQKIIKSTLHQFDSAQLIIEADKHTSFGFVVNVMDHVRKAGCYDIILAADKK